MKEKLKTIAAFSLLGLLVLAAAVLTVLDRPRDLSFRPDAPIRLYGEQHGSPLHYETELSLWQACYDRGDRSLFVELPYYSAEFLNLWMRDDGDELLDALFEDIRGTADDNPHFAAFLRGIRDSCPETVFYGTDVGHQYGSTGARYLAWLEENGLAGSENRRLAEECIRQGKEYAASGSSDGISPVREAYMTANFLDAYARCGEERVMGIYGSYHTDASVPDRMAGALAAHFGDRLSAVSLRTLCTAGLYELKPYRLGLSVVGPVFLVLLFAPNILWAIRKKPEGYAEAARRENRLLALLERVGEVAVTAALLLFKNLDPVVLRLSGGTFFSMRLSFLALSLALMLLYEGYWIRYFRSPGTLRDFYSSFAGFPVAGATLPVIAALLLGIYAGNWILIGASLVLAVGHIGIHLAHRRELAPAD